MAEEIKKVIVIDTKSSSKTIKSLKKDIDLLTSSLEELEIGSAEYNKTLELLSKRQRSFNEIQEKINKSSFNTVQRWESIARLSSGLAAGYGAATSAITLFGKESENLDRIMVKLQGTIGLVQGIGGLKDLVQELPLVGEAFNKVISFINPFDKKLTDIATNLNNIDLGKLKETQTAINDIASGDINIDIDGGFGSKEYVDNVNAATKGTTSYVGVVGKSNELNEALTRAYASQQKALKDLELLRAKEIGTIRGANQVLELNKQYLAEGKIGHLQYGRTVLQQQDIIKKATTALSGYNSRIKVTQQNLGTLSANIASAATVTKTASRTISTAFKTIGSAVGWTLLITAILTAISKVWDYVSSIKSAKKEQEEFNKSIYEAANNISAKTLVAFKQLQQAYSEVGDSAQAKQKFLKDYADQIEETGLKLNTVNDLDAAFINNTDAYVNAIMARAKAQALENKAVEIYEEFLNKRSELEESITSGEASDLTFWQTIQQGILRAPQDGTYIPPGNIDFAEDLESSQRASNVKKVEDEIVSITEETNNKLKDMFNEIVQLEGQYVGFFNVDKVKQNSTAVKATVNELDQWLKARAESKLTEEQKLENEYNRLRALAKDNDVALLEIEAWYQEELAKIKQKGIDEQKAADAKAANDRWNNLQAELKRIRDLAVSSNLNPQDKLYQTQYQQNFAKGFGLSGQFIYQSKDDLKRQYDDQVAYNNEIFNLTKSRIDQENELLNKALQDESLNADRKLEIERTLRENQMALSDAALQREKQNIAAYKSLQDAKNQALQSTLSVASNIAGSMAQIWGEESKTGKAFATAQALIDTYSSANAAYSAMAGIPIVGPGLGIAAAAAAIVAGIANVKAIWAVNESGTSSSPSVAAPPAITAPPVEYTRNLLGDREIEELNQPVKCYVLESDITNTQNKVAVTESNASF